MGLLVLDACIDSWLDLTQTPILLFRPNSATYLVVSLSEDVFSLTFDFSFCPIKTKSQTK
jgi:hypothetical protein